MRKPAEYWLSRTRGDDFSLPPQNHGNRYTTVMNLSALYLLSGKKCPVIWANRGGSIVESRPPRLTFRGLGS